MEPEALRRRARLSQAGAEHDQTRLSGRDTDPDYIRDLEHFPSLTHRQIHDRVQAMRPADLHTAADTWISIADSIFGAVTTLHATVQTALTDSMSGHLADAAATAARRFVQDATDTAEITHSTGHRIIATAYAAEALRKTVPPPKTDGPTADRDEQYHLALAALDANYTPIYPPAGAGVPAFFTVMTPAGAAGAFSGGATDPAAALTEGSAFTPQSAAPGGQVPGGFLGTRQQVSDPTASSTNAPVPQSIPGLRDALDTNSPTSRSTAPDKTDQGPESSPNHQSSNTARPLDVGTTPATTTGPGSPTRTATTPTADPARTGRPTTPSPTFPWSHPFSPNPFPDPSHSFPGPPSPEPTTPTRPLTTLDRPATAAATPPGMFAPGTRANQSPETSHRCPTWLVRDRQDELLGAALPHVAPILGAEFPSARNDPIQQADDRPG
ncbi:PPE domain-containing protein [Nocardia tengchongensis]